MSKLVVRVKILPSDAETNLDEVSKMLSHTIPSGMELNAVSKQPIAFGLFSLLVDFILEDSEGQMNKLEDFLGKTEGVGQFEVMSMSRRSVQIK
ncbi:MAG TPA: elongation factor 1-beta [Nitrososphaeraceae archaeon]|jgi:elongation factor 1-beta|nr:elongation factor 1-beta [Nitrososphaeraceae archaeon]